jgi:hypothetical protein
MSIVERTASQPQYEQPDFARGCREIGATIGIDRRAAWTLINSGALKSVKKVGGRFWASRQRLLREVGGE